MTITSFLSYLREYIQMTRGWLHAYSEDNKLGGKGTVLKATNFKHYAVNNG